MFVPTEGIGACVARIVSECGLKPLRMEFTEEKAVVEFAQCDSATPSPDANDPNGLPESGWTREGHKWRNGNLLMSVAEISDRIGVSGKVLRQRLYSRGRITTFVKRSKFDRISKRKRFATSETQKE